MISRILVALDGSDRAPGVFAAAVELAARFRAALQPFRAVTVPPEFPAAKHSTMTPKKSSLCWTALVAPLSANTNVPVRSNTANSVVKGCSRAGGIIRIATLVPQQRSLEPPPAGWAG